MQMEYCAIYYIVLMEQYIAWKEETFLIEYSHLIF